MGDPWDCLAGALMITEAGGRALPIGTDPGGVLVLAAGPCVFNDLCAVIARAPPDQINPDQTYHARMRAPSGS
ncbi:hypothetical protein [Pseudotabrizicola sp. 4114]|uniref:hypothetical protein n=1 Tax=Pseudotabrizicola sp. 4114 TaxID=2817731 RepID=UPI0028629FA5|nr:hypothetical protein [Pseudorhodobacter sp. 4114]